MYFVLYDRNLNSIGETYILESWNRTQRAKDFDDIKIVGEQIPQSANPFLVVVNDRQGRQMFSGLASTPTIDEKTKKTTIQFKDYLTLFNSEIILDWSTFTGTTIGSLLQFVLSAFNRQVDTGFMKGKGISINLSSINGYLDSNIVYSAKKTENVKASDVLKDIMNYYDLTYEFILNLKTKVLQIKFSNVAYNLGVSYKAQKIKLSDFGLSSIEKSFGDCNKVVVYNHLYEKKQEWALTQDNQVVKLPTDKELIYPTKIKNFIAEEPAENETETDKVNDAIYDAVVELANNRYQESIELDAQQYKSIIDLTALNFTDKLEVFMSDGSSRFLPIGEIETDSKGKHIIRLGYDIQELTQII